MLTICGAVTFLKFGLGSIDVVWLTGPAAVSLSVPDGFRLDRNDLAGESYQSVTSIRIPFASVKALHVSPKSPNTWFEVAQCTFDSVIDMYAAPQGWQEHAHKQRVFIMQQDAPTRRAAILYSPDDRLDESHLPSGEF